MAAPTSNNEVTARRLTRLLTGSDGNGGLWGKVNDKISSSINALDVSSVGGAGKYISAISETDGKISATATTMDTTPTASSTNAVTSGGVKTALDGKAASSHTHGNITNGGALQTTDVTIANGDKLVVTDASDSNKVARTSIAFDGSTTGQLLSKAGSFQYPKEAYLEWGGKNFTGTYGPIDAAMISEIGANRFAFGKAAGIVVEYTRDGGTTWVDYGLTDAQKSAIFSTGQSIKIGKSDSTNNAIKVGTNNYKNYKVRVTITTNTFGVYSQLHKFVIYCSTSGSQGPKVTLSGRTRANVSAGTDTWSNFGTMTLGGWSGYNVLNTGDITTYGYQNSQFQQLRFLFEDTVAPTNADYEQYQGLSVSRILGFGGVGWQTPSTMASNGHLYAYDYAKNATFPANVTATKFIGPLQGNADTATTANNYNTTTGTIKTKFDSKEDFAAIATSGIIGDTNGEPTVADVKTYFNGLPDNYSRIVYKRAGYERTLIFGRGSTNNGHIFSIGNNDKYLRILRNNAGTWSTDWEKISAGYSDSSGSAGKLTTARKTYVTLGTASTSTTRDWSGDTTIPVDGTLSVANGGTGKTSVTANSFLIGNGTSAMVEKTPAEVRSLIGAGTSSLTLGETSSTAYRGDRGKTAYDHSQATHAPTTSAAAASGGTTLSLVTTGEKYTWNNKSDLTIGTTATTAAAGNHTHTLTLASGGTSTVDLSANTAYTLTAGGKSIVFKTPADNNTDTKQRIVASTAKTYLTGVTTAPTSSNQDLTGVASTKVYATDGVLTATSFSGNLTGNVTGNCSGSSGSCTGNAATATTAAGYTSDGAIATALGNKVDKVSGKGLSTNDFTNAYKTNVDSNTSARHTHSNKSVLDGISTNNLVYDCGTGSSSTTDFDNALAAFNAGKWVIIHNSGNLPYYCVGSYSGPGLRFKAFADETQLLKVYTLVWTRGSAPTAGTQFEASLVGHTHSNYVPLTRTINGKSLDVNIELSASDVGAGKISRAYFDNNGDLQYEPQEEIEIKEEEDSPNRLVRFVNGSSYNNEGYLVPTPSASAMLGTNADGDISWNSASAVKTFLGLGSAAYTASTAYATSGHTHTLSIASGGSSPTSLSANTTYTLSAGGKTLVFKTPADTTYSSKTEASGDSAVSLCTRGEKYTWNHKQNALPSAWDAASGPTYGIALDEGGIDKSLKNISNSTTGMTSDTYILVHDEVGETSSWRSRHINKLWDWVKGKIGSVLNLYTRDNDTPYFGGVAANAVQAISVTNANITRTADTTNGDKLQIGTGTAVNITNAGRANYADNAGFAPNAGHASSADIATKAEQDATGAILEPLVINYNSGTFPDVFNQLTTAHGSKRRIYCLYSLAVAGSTDRAEIKIPLSSVRFSSSGSVKSFEFVTPFISRGSSSSDIAGQITVITVNHLDNGSYNWGIEFQWPYAANQAGYANTAGTANDYNTSTGTIKTALDGKAPNSHTHDSRYLKILTDSTTSAYFDYDNAKTRGIHFINASNSQHTDSNPGPYSGNLTLFVLANATGTRVFQVAFGSTFAIQARRWDGSKWSNWKVVSMS